MKGKNYGKKDFLRQRIFARLHVSSWPKSLSKTLKTAQTVSRREMPIIDMDWVLYWFSEILFFSGMLGTGCVSEVALGNICLLLQKSPYVSPPVRGCSRRRPECASHQRHPLLRSSAAWTWNADAPRLSRWWRTLLPAPKTSDPAHLKINQLIWLNANAPTCFYSDNQKDKRIKSLLVCPSHNMTV